MTHLSNLPTPKQQRFVEEYLVDPNAAQAAIRAGYSAKTAKEIGYENLTKPHIQVAIQEAKAERSARTQVSQDLVIEEYARLAFLDPRKFFNADGSLKHITKLDDDSAAALASMEINLVRVDQNTESSTAKIKFWDKSRNLNDLAKHLGMFEKDKIQKGKDGPTAVTVSFVDPPPRESC